MAIAASIIQAFLQHQFAKERAEQENRMVQERQKQAQQASLQQALMMREVIGDQLKARQDEAIAARKQQADEARALRERLFQEALEVRKSQFTERMEEMKARREDLIERRQAALDERQQMAEFTDKLIRERTKASQTESDRLLRERQLDQPALPGTYLNELGHVVPTPASRRVAKELNLRHLPQGSVQEATFGAGNIMYNHLTLTLSEITRLYKKQILELGSNRAKQFLKTEVSRLSGDPDVAPLLKLLDPATSLAIARQYSTPGVGGVRGGVQLAKMFQGGLYEEGDNLLAIAQKLRIAARLAKMGQEDQALTGVYGTGKFNRFLSVLDQLSPEGEQ